MNRQPALRPPILSLILVLQIFSGCNADGKSNERSRAASASAAPSDERPQGRVSPVFANVQGFVFRPLTGERKEIVTATFKAGLPPGIELQRFSPVSTFFTDGTWARVEGYEALIKAPTLSSIEKRRVVIGALVGDKKGSSALGGKAVRITQGDRISIYFWHRGKPLISVFGSRSASVERVAHAVLLNNYE